MIAENQTTRPPIEGQLNPAERAFISKAILEAPIKPKIALEIGTCWAAAARCTFSTPCIKMEPATCGVWKHPGTFTKK